MNRIELYTVTHKAFPVPEEKIYKTIIVGNGKVNINNALRDNDGDNIAHKNSAFCEMTALYWIWKNTTHEPNDIVGLNHYRRYFCSNNKKNKIQEYEIKNLLSKYDILVPKKRSYYFISVEQHYSKAHNKTDLSKLRDIVKDIEPTYLTAFDTIMSGNKISLYNMLITKWWLFESYCYWLFPILFKLESNIDRTNYDLYQSRVIGFLAERLFNVWLEQNKDKIKIHEIPVFNVEGENVILKGFNLLKRHYLP